MALQEISAVVLTVSLLNERLIEILKTYIPWFADQFDELSDEKTKRQEQFRKIIIQSITIITGVIAASILAYEEKEFEWYCFHSAVYKEVNVIILGVLSSGGSAVWNHIIGFLKAVKDVRRQALSNLKKQQ